MTTLERCNMELAEGWQGAVSKIPFIQFPPDWQIQVIPPFGGALCRFQVLLPSNKKISVYLDWNDSLGCVGEPYWEVYPSLGDARRCLLLEIPELLQLIADGDKSSTPLLDN